MKTIVDYAEKVKAQHALNKTLAPVETDLTDASQAYAIGDQFIYDGVLYKAKTAIAQHDALVLDTNYEAADDITTQIKNKTVTTDPVPTEGSTNPVQSNGVYVENRNIYEVMGEMGAKNLLPNIASSGSYASSGTVTKNANGSLTINGTFDAVTTINIDYLDGLSNAVFDVTDLIGTDIVVTFLDTAVSGITLQVGYFNSAGTRSSLDGVSTKANITFPAGAVKSATYLRIASGTYDNVTVYPMMQLASDTGSTYQPYAKTNKQLTAENEALTNKLNNEIVTRSALGAKNILPFDLDDIKALNTNGTWAGNVYTYRDVDFEVNADGTVTANGTATGGNASIKLFNASANYEMLGKKVILNGCPSGGSATTYRIQAYRMGSADGSTGTYFDDGEGTIAFDALNNASGTVGSFAVAVYENATVTNLLFKPMVRLASDTDATYQPYAKTNRELTAENQTLTNLTDMLVNNGVVNVLENTATTQTVGSEVTYTVNADKTVTATFTSSPTESRNLDVCGSFTIDKAMHLSGCPSGGGQGVYRLFAKLSNASTYYNDDGNGVLLPAGSYDYIRITVGTSASASSSPLVFKPMISDPILNLSYGDYVPYAKTNRELTEDIASGYLISSTYVNVTVTADGIKTYKELLTELFTKIDTTQQEQNYEYFIFAWLIIDGNSALNVNGLRPYSRSATTTFFEVGSDSSALKIAHIEFKATTSTYHYAEIGSSVTFTDKTNTVPAVSSVITARLYKCVPQNMS